MLVTQIVTKARSLFIFIISPPIRTRYNLKHLWDFVLSRHDKPQYDLIEVLQCVRYQGKFLDIGCGTGGNLGYALSQGWNSVGIEISDIGLWITKIKLRSTTSELELYRGDFVKWREDLDFKFDFVLDVGCFTGMSCGQRKLYVDRLTKLLNTMKGSYLLFTFEEKRIHENTVGISHENLKALFSNKFNSVYRKTFLSGGVKSAWYLFTHDPELIPPENYFRVTMLFSTDVPMSSQYG